MKIEPFYSDALDWVKASYESVHGAIQMAWERKENDIYYEITVPPNTQAKIVLPFFGCKIDSDIPYEIEQGSGRIEMKVKSGSYKFAVATKKGA